MNAKKTSFILDGKLAPPKIAAVAGREAVLCHYRRDKVPHKILVRSHDDSIRGTIVAMNSETLRLTSPAGSHQITIEKDALFQVDGVPADLQAVIKKGGNLVIYPSQGRTIVAFAPIDLKYKGFFGLYQVMAGRPCRSAGFASRTRYLFLLMNVASTP